MVSLEKHFCILYIHVYTHYNHMLQNFQQLTELKLYAYIYTQYTFTLQGWEVCQSCDMNAFYGSQPPPERQRVELLELFDEYEEWHLKCSHYMMLCAFKGCCRSLAAAPLLPAVLSDPHHCIKGSVEIYPLSMSSDSTSVSRYK